MPTVALRTAGPPDFGRVFSYIRRLGDAEGLPDDLRIDEETLRRDWFGAYRGEAVFAEIGNRAAGFAVCLPDGMVADFPEALYMAAVFVDAEFRRGGVGRSFFAWLVGRARAHGRTRIVWCCLVDNAAALAFSERLGAVDQGVRTIRLGTASRDVRYFTLEVERADVL